MSPPTMDIVIVNYNSAGRLRDCLASVRACRCGGDLRIYVQDNASGPADQGLLAELRGVELFRNDRNLGFSRAVNQALEKGRAPYAVLLNPDTVMHDDFLEVAFRYMEGHPDVGVLGPKILDPDGTVQGSARSFPTPLTALFGRTSFLSRVWPNNRFTCDNLQTAASDGRTPFAVDWVSGACMVVRRAAIEQVGPLDEGFFMFWEDADWCRRMREAGWKVVYCPMTAVVHHVGGSTRSLRIRSQWAFHRSCYRLYYKYNRDARHRLLKPLVVSGLALRFAGVALAGLLPRRPSADGCKPGARPPSTDCPRQIRPPDMPPSERKSPMPGDVA